MSKFNVIVISLALVTCAGIFAGFRQPSVSTKFMQITTIESVVPGGLGRSRMISVSNDGSFKEDKMENFFSMAGINFENVRSNDQMITMRLEQMTAEGWELHSITPGVYAADKSTGIFITRYLFKK